jgi:predicted RecA/RadA family phage recombinase
MATGDRVNFSGDLTFTAPTGGVTRGKIYNDEDIYVVARETADATEEYLGAVTGGVTMTKATGTGKSFSRGDEVFAVSNQADVTASGAVLIGWALSDASTSDTTVDVYLTGLPVTAS